TFDQGLGGSIRAGAYGANSVQALYSIAGGGQLTIVAKAYDSDASAKTALMYEMNTVSVGPDVTKTVRGGTLYEYSRYSGFRMHIGAHTFDVHVFGGAPPSVPSAIMQKVSVALIDLMAPR